MDNTVALGIQPFKVDVATPLMQAAKIKQEQVETQQRTQALQQDAAGQFARGVAVYADKPEFAQKWSEGLDDLHSRGLMPTQAYQNLRDNPSPMVLQSILAQTQKPELALAQKQFEESRRHAGVEESQGQQRIDLTSLQPVKIGEGLTGDIFGVRDPKAPGGYRLIDPKSMGAMPGAPAPQPGGPQPGTPAQPGTPPAIGGAPNVSVPAAVGAPGAVPAAPVVPPIAPAKTARDIAGQKYLDDNFDKKDHGLIESVADYNTNPQTIPMKQRTRVLEAAENLAKARGETYDQANYAMRSDAMKKFATGKEGTAVRSFNVGLEHLDQLSELGKALDNGDIPKINALKNWVKTNLGQDAPTNFNGLKAVVGAEIVKAIVGAGGTGEERAAAAKTVADASSPAQLAGIIKTYKGAMGAQLGGLERQYETGTLRKDFRSKLSPAAQRAVEEHEKGGAAGAAEGAKPVTSGKTQSGVTWSVQ